MSVRIEVALRKITIGPKGAKVHFLAVRTLGDEKTVLKNEHIRMKEGEVLVLNLTEESDGQR